MRLFSVIGCRSQQNYAQAIWKNKDKDVTKAEFLNFYDMRPHVLLVVVAVIYMSSDTFHTSTDYFWLLSW